MPNGVLTPSGSGFEPKEDGGGNESDKCPNLVPEVTSSKRRTKGLPKPTCEAITQAHHDFNPATPAAGGKRAHETLSDVEQSLPR